jgi:hypothetical protein
MSLHPSVLLTEGHLKLLVLFYFWLSGEKELGVELDIYIY